MDAPLLAVLGVVLIVGALVDVVVTTLGVGIGAGRIADVSSRVVLGMAHAGNPRHHRRQLAGIATTAITPLAWLCLVWGGFALLFLSDARAVVDAANQQPTSGLGRVAYAAGALAGAGAGLVAGSPVWQLVNNIAALAGLALVTLSLTFLMQVVSAVVAERSTMSQIAALAGRQAGPSGQAEDTLPLQLVLIADGLSMAAQRHLALPLLQYHHARRPDSAASVNLVRYDRLLAELEARTGQGPTVAAGGAAIEAFLRTLRLDVTAGNRPARLQAFLRNEGWDTSELAPLAGDRVADVTSGHRG